MGDCSCVACCEHACQPSESRRYSVDIVDVAMCLLAGDDFGHKGELGKRTRGNNLLFK